MVKASDIPGLRLNNARTRKELFLQRRLDQLDYPHIADLPTMGKRNLPLFSLSTMLMLMIVLGSNTSVHDVTQILGLSRANGQKMRKEAMDCLAKSDFSDLLEKKGKGSEFAARYRTQLWAATRHILEAGGLGRRWFDGITTSDMKWQQDSTR